MGSVKRNKNWRQEQYLKRVKRAQRIRPRGSYWGVGADNKLYANNIVYDYVKNYRDIDYEYYYALIRMRYLDKKSRKHMHMAYDGRWKRKYGKTRTLSKQKFHTDLKKQNII